MLRTIRALVLGGLALLLALGPGLAAAAPRTAERPLVTFGVGPAGAARADGRALFRYSLPAGGVIMDHVAVINQSSRPLTLLAYPSDAFTSADGSLEIRERASRNAEMGAWVTLGDAAATGQLDPSARSLVQVTVPAQSRRGPGQVLLPMRIAVPTDASPGDHVGGVAVALIAKGNSPQAQNVDLEQRVVSRIYLDVPGVRKPALDLDILDTSYAGGSGLGLKGVLTVTYRLRNTGNVRLGAKTALTTRGLFGLGRTQSAGPLANELLPGGSAVLTAAMHDVPPTVLGTVRVTATSVAAPLGETPSMAPVSDSARYWAVTWQEIAALLLLVATVLYRRWRRTRRTAPKHAKAGPELRELAGVGVVVVMVATVLAMALPGRANAADRHLGSIAVSPTAGTNQTLFDGAIADAHCPNGTVNSFFTVDGPGLPANTAFIGFGNKTGTGFSSFRGASIANIRAANAGSFERSGAYTIRFGCDAGHSQGVTASYTRVMDYNAGSGGSFRLRGYPTSSPTRVPLPTEPEPDVSSPTPSPTRSASAHPTGSPVVSSSPATSTDPHPASAGRDQRVVASEGRSWWLAAPLGAGLVLATGVLLGRRRRLRPADR